MISEDKDNKQALVAPPPDNYNNQYANTEVGDDAYETKNQLSTCFNDLLYMYKYFLESLHLKDLPARLVLHETTLVLIPQINPSAHSPSRRRFC